MIEKAETEKLLTQDSVLDFGLTEMGEFVTRTQVGWLIPNNLQNSMICTSLSKDLKSSTIYSLWGPLPLLTLWTSCVLCIKWTGSHFLTFFRNWSFQALGGWSPGKHLPLYGICLLCWMDLISGVIRSINLNIKDPLELINIIEFTHLNWWLTLCVVNWSILTIWKGKNLW